MSRERFYEVRREAYLFPAQSLPDTDTNSQEEQVRQWAAFELIRAYGVQVTNITFECPVRVGSKTYRIDILVLRDGKPWIVVECKKPSHRKTEEGMAQAISYASAQTIQAEFAVYTNGDAWQVKRRVQGRWIAVPDLPGPMVGTHGQSITLWLQSMWDAAPLLRRLHTPLEGDEALRFLTKLQSFFCGWTLLTEGNNVYLQGAVDHLLRVLATPDSDYVYARGKLAVAQQELERYRQEQGYDMEICPIGSESIRIEIRHLYGTMVNRIEGTQDLDSSDSLLLRLIVAILEYGQARETPSAKYPVISKALHESLEAYLEFALKVRLGLSLPDPLDALSVNDMRGACGFAEE